MRDFILSTLSEQIGISPDYKIRESALSWYDKGVLTKDDIYAINARLPAYGPTLHDAQNTKQNQNNTLLANWLSTHFITWTDGEQYGVTLADQQLMSLYFSSYSMGLREKLEWNSHTKKCREFTVEEFKQLSQKVNDYVEPLVKYCQEIKEQIYACETIDAVNSIVIDYSSVSL